MPKIRYEDKALSEDKLNLIRHINKILLAYEEQGYDLSLRQLYYQLIAHDILPDTWIDEAYNDKHGLEWDTKNTEKNYKKLGTLVNEGRMCGHIDWDHIVDRGRELVTPAHWNHPVEILDACSEQFRVDRWSAQPYHIICMVEKQALEGVLEPLCHELDIDFVANKGYSSQSTMWRIGQKIGKISRRPNKNGIVVLYLGDHDPSGLDMDRDVKERLELFAQCDIVFQRLGLTWEQIEEFQPPENPAKLTDSRAKKYIETYGTSSWELDALDPETLSELVRNAVNSFRHDSAWNTVMSEEDEMKTTLQGIREYYTEVQAFLSTLPPSSKIF